MFGAVGDFFTRLFDPEGFPARWNCGEWAPFDAWFLISSDFAIFGAYSAIPISIVIYMAAKQREIVFPKLYWLFAAFILSCGLTHLIDAIIFWHPVYRLSGLVKFITAVVSWATVIVLVRSLGPALNLPGAARLNSELQREIADHRRSEAALRESSSRLGLVLDHAKLGDWCWYPESDVLEFSPRSFEIFGMSPRNPLTWTELNAHLVEEDRDNVRLAVEAAVSKRQDYNTEYRVTRESDGAQVWINAKALAEYDANGSATRMLGIVEDVTDRKLAEVEREQLLLSEQAARAEAESANRAKDEFLAILSHELRTPLNAILGWAHVLKAEQHETNTLKGLAVIERNAVAQAQLVDDLLDMNRIITGKVRLDVQRVDLAAVIQAAYDAVKPSADSKDVRLVTVLDPIAGPVKGDPSRLQQVIWNLLTNAIKFTSKGGRVQISLERVNSHIEITVSDNGEGISPEFLPFVFEQFRQSDSSTTRRQRGLGLGLSIVKNLVEMHGGSVHAKSAGENQGTTFRVALPLQPTGHDSDGDTGRTHPAASSSGDLPPPSKTALQGGSVVVVEDDPDSLLALQRILENHGASVCVCTSASEALEAIHRQRFHALISDIGLPGTDGYALIAQIRSEVSPNQQVPAIALTAFSRSEDRRRAMVAGFDTFLSKPVNPGELMAAVERCIIRSGA